MKVILLVFFLITSTQELIAQNMADTLQQYVMNENKEIKLAKGFTYTEKAKELLDKLRTMRVIKN